ncbi:MAG: hypothetical protein V7746_19050 [Halioglobus sp.]
MTNEKMSTKTRNVIAAVSFLLMAGPGTSMAEDRNDCPDGALAGGVYKDLVIKGGGDCYIMNVLVTGDITAKNMDQISIVSSTVNGSISFTSSNSAFVYNNVVNGDTITTWGNASSTVARNTVNSGNIAVNDVECSQRQSAIAEENVIYGGSLRVNCNETATVRNNTVRDGTISCRDNDRLDSLDNDARGTNSEVKCSNGIGD